MKRVVESQQALQLVVVDAEVDCLLSLERGCGNGLAFSIVMKEYLYGREEELLQRKDRRGVVDDDVRRVFDRGKDEALALRHRSNNAMLLAEDGDSIRDLIVRDCLLHIWASSVDRAQQHLERGSYVITI